jgi:hypothetical protein
MFQSDYVTTPTEDWQDLVAWDGDLYDPTFQDDTGFVGAQGDNLTCNYHLSESLGSEQPYLVSATSSIAGGPPSLEHAVSGPLSALSGSSFEQIYCTSPSFDTTTKSPLVGPENGCYFGSFDACDSVPSPASYPSEPLVLDTRFQRIKDSFDSTTPETVFNPYVAGSSHSFSGLDVRASQIFANVGTWVDHPQIVEPIAEADEYDIETTAIPVPQLHSPRFNDPPTSYPRSHPCEQPSRSRAVTIPQSNRHSASYSTALAHSQWAQRVPSAHSVSPIAHRRPRSVNMSRSSSRAESRRRTTTPSPTSDGFGWVSYHMNSQTNRLAPTSTEGLQGRTPRGRKKGLTAEQRSHAALMRIVGACMNCQRRKEKCDPGTPCKSCLEYYKGDLVNHPCRDRLLSDLSSNFLSDRLGWHPTARALESFIGSNNFDISSGITYTIPLNFGFGPPMMVPVHALYIGDGQELVHEHIIYPWPPESSCGSAQNHAVLPAVLTDAAISDLMQSLDTHLSLLVAHHFRSFPLYCSPLRILREVYIFYRSLPVDTAYSRTLQQALKLLVLVHVGGDITLPSPGDSSILAQLIHTTMDTTSDALPTPCFIRSQFGSVMPILALTLMKDVLSSLEQMLLNHDHHEWPIVLATLMTVLMTIESIHYHAAKLPYHHSLNCARPSNAEEDLRLDDDGVKTLLAFYGACFTDCHARLRPDWEGETRRASSTATPEDMFIESVRDGIRKASAVGYLSRKATEVRQEDDMGYFFDRLVARLLLLRC